MSCLDQEPRSRPRALLCWFWRSCYALWLEEKCGANFVTDLPPCFFPRLEPASHLKRFENDSDWLILLPVFRSCNWSESSQRVLITVKPQYNEPLYNEVHGITNDMLRHYTGKNLDITKPRHIEHTLPVPCPFDISRLRCTRLLVAQHWNKSHFIVASWWPR